MQIVSMACWYNNWKKNKQTKQLHLILSKFTVFFCLFSYFVFYFSKLKLILFYDWVIYYNTNKNTNFASAPCVCVYIYMYIYVCMYVCACEVSVSVWNKKYAKKK